MKTAMRRWAGLACCALAMSGTLGAETLDDVLKQVMARPEYKHSYFGLEVYSLKTHKVLYAYNGQGFFTPGSTTKLLSVGTALHLLGQDYRFHTPIYKTGTVTNGVLKGDLVLVASGDPNLSGRMGPDGTLAFSDEDHSYGGFDSRLVKGDPLAPLRDLAAQIKKAGIRHVDGRVLVDASLFPEGEHEGGTGVVISSIVVNDNVVDCVLKPGAKAGDAVTVVTTAPVLPFLHFVNKVTTAEAGSEPGVDMTPQTGADGALEVTLSGTLPAGQGEYVSSMSVSDPSGYAARVMTALLKEAGVTVANTRTAEKPVGDLYKSSYTEANKVAEWVSAPLKEDAKVTLKVSQNLHAAMMPMLVGALKGNEHSKSDRKGFDLENAMLKSGGLDLTGASQSDGAGGLAYFTPDFMVHYLAWMAEQPEGSALRRGLPVLGKDGTLFNIQTNSAAAGHVFAKTGTNGVEDKLNHGLLVTGKGLAGYTKTAEGEPVAFATYVNYVPLPLKSDAITNYPGQALGEIAGAIHLDPVK